MPRAKKANKTPAKSTEVTTQKRMEALSAKASKVETPVRKARRRAPATKKAFDKQKFLAAQAMKHLAAAAEVISGMDKASPAVLAVGASVFAGSHALKTAFA